MSNISVIQCGMCSRIPAPIKDIFLDSNWSTVGTFSGTKSGGGGSYSMMDGLHYAAVLLVWSVVLAPNKHSANATVADHSKWSAPTHKLTIEAGEKYI